MFRIYDKKSSKWSLLFKKKVAKQNLMDSVSRVYSCLLTDSYYSFYIQHCYLDGKLQLVENILCKILPFLLFLCILLTNFKSLITFYQIMS